MCNRWINFEHKWVISDFDYFSLNDFVDLRDNNLFYKEMENRCNNSIIKDMTFKDFNFCLKNFIDIDICSNE